MANFIDKLNPFKTKRQGQEKLPNQWNQLFLSELGRISWEESRDDYWVDEGYQKNPAVYSIVKDTSYAGGNLPWIVKDRKTGKAIDMHKVDPMLRDMLYKPNPLQTWNNFIQQTIGFKMLNGNAFIWGTYPENKQSINKDDFQFLFNLPSQYVQIIADEISTNIKGYSLDFAWTGEDIPAEQVYHIRDFNPEYDETGTFLYGQSPLQSVRRSLSVNNQCIDAMQALMLNLGPPGILGMKGEGSEIMDEEQLLKIKSQLKKNNQGAKNHMEFPVNNMEWKWTELGSDPRKLEIEAKYKSTQKDICAAFNYPFLLLEGNSTFNNQTEAKKSFYENVVIPIMSEIRDALNCFWIDPQFDGKYYLDFDTSGVKALQEDLDVQANSIMKLRGILTTNELREKLGYDPKEGGDELTPGFNDQSQMANPNESIADTVIGGANPDME